VNGTYDHDYAAKLTCDESAPYCATPMLRSGEYEWSMVLEERTYTINPGQIPAFLAIYEVRGLLHGGDTSASPWVGPHPSSGNSIRSSTCGALRAWTTAPSGVLLSMEALSGKPSFQKPLSSSRSKRTGYSCLLGSRRCAEGWQRRHQLVTLAPASVNL
jgi:hypothetical protein